MEIKYSMTTKILYETLPYFMKYIYTLDITLMNMSYMSIHSSDKYVFFLWSDTYLGKGK